MRPGRYPTSHPLEQRARQQLRDKTAYDTKQPGYGTEQTDQPTRPVTSRRPTVNPSQPRRWT